ncbi:MAG: ABC transporter ATP-binding protein [Deltaproteobacteria bacterium]|nr:ABC transporter ATP-binding protein [Deltaproteobacteria bacterium]
MDPPRTPDITGSAAISVSKASKSFLHQPALRDITLTLSAKSLTLLCGANGSGKSTLLRAIAGLSRLDSGSLSYSGAPKGAAPRALVGYLGHHLMLYPHLSVLENGEFAARMLGTACDIGAQLNEWGLEPHAHKRVHELSKGLQARAALMRIFIGEPAYLLLDEPTSALDEAGVEILARRIERLRAANEQCCVLIATHDIARLGSLAERVVVLGAGAILFDTENCDEIDSNRAREEAFNLYSRINR